MVGDWTSVGDRGRHDVSVCMFAVIRLMPPGPARSPPLFFYSPSYIYIYIYIV